MRFVVHEQHMLSEETRMQRPRLEPSAVGAEEQPTSDHVHRPNDDCRSGRVCAPRAVVGELTSKRADCHGSVETRKFAGILNTQSAETPCNCGASRVLEGFA